MPDILSAYAASQPDKPAVIDDRPERSIVSWSYADLEAESNRLANTLSALGAGPDQKVVWCGPNSPQIASAISAPRKTGAGAAPPHSRPTVGAARHLARHPAH